MTEQELHSIINQLGGPVGFIDTLTQITRFSHCPLTRKLSNKLKNFESIYHFFTAPSKTSFYLEIKQPNDAWATPFDRIDIHYGAISQCGKSLEHHFPFIKCADSRYVLLATQSQITNHKSQITNHQPPL
ncbi:hypothetical protein [Rubritalea tangerina]